ncbi:MAG: FtsK/SpoIIIE domain-containing protein [Actinomycetota bacterium]|nr:FtsK/SpoIIIE domain-containing protein [Actinomycetota bacterium]
MPAQCRRSSQPAQSIAPVLVLAAIAIACVSSWFGLPAIAVLWACVLLVAWLEPPAVLTGKKDDWGYLTPANPTEETRQRRFRQWRQLRFSLVPLPGLATGLAPGWPPLASWCAGLWAAALGWLVPVVGDRYLHASTGRLLDAIAGFVLVTEIAAARRSVAAAEHPGTRLDSLVPAIRRAPGVMLARMVPGAVGGFALGVALVTLVHTYGARFGWGGLVAQLHLDPHLAHPGVVLASPAALEGLLACGGALLAVGRPWQKVALEGWVELVSVRAAWAARWAGLKLDEPALVDHQVLGSATIDTFEAPAHLGSAAFLPLGPKLVPALGSGTAVAVLEHPDISASLPVPGTRHPRLFDVVVWPAGNLPDPTSEADLVSVQLFAHAAMVWILEPLGYGRPVPVRVERLTAPESQKRIWSSTWAWPGGPDLKTIRQASAPGGGPLVSKFQTAFSCPVLMDHHGGDGSGRVYFGAIGDEEAVLADEHQHLAERFGELAAEDRWATIWESVLKKGSIHPSVSHKMTTSRPLGAVAVKRMAFLTPWGIDPGEFLGLEAKLATALGAAPFVSVTGWTQKGSGERHPQAFAVHWAETAVPGSPDLVPPTEAAPWVLAGQVAAAFDDVRLARPEVVEAVPLSAERSKAYLWRITLQLYGGVTAADVRARAERIRRALHVPWLRVEDAPGGVTCYVGADPAAVELANPKKDALRLAALDWDQAWADVGVVGSDGDVPHLQALGRLPRNPAVEVRDFSLPPGVDRARVKGALGKLKAATANAFVEVRESPAGASSVRLLVAERNPLPQTVPFDFRAADAASGFAFATGVEGSPVVFDPAESPHLLLAGVTGAGKSSTAQALLYDAAAAGCDVYLVDPVKGGADYAFLRDHAMAVAGDALEAAAVMKAVYAEVVRRKDLNARHGVGSVFELPEELRPRRIVVMIDEFTSLIGQDPVPKQPFDDPEEEAERQRQLAINLARQLVGIYAGRFAREARSAGVTLLLGTQKLMAKTLDTLPGGSDLKTNLARILLGKASGGERMSALRAFDDAPVLEGDIPKGRGLWEPLTTTAVVIQCWWASQETYRSELDRRVPKLEPGQRLDLAAWMPKAGDDPPPSARSRPPLQPFAVEEPVVDLGELELSLDDLEAGEIDEPGDLAPVPPGGPAPDWSELEIVDAVGVRSPSEQATDDDPRWAIDWGDESSPAGRAEPAAEDGAGSSGRDGPAQSVLDDEAGSISHAAPADGPLGTVIVDADDAWGLVPEPSRRTDHPNTGDDDLVVDGF